MNAHTDTPSMLDLLEPLSEATAQRILSNAVLRENCSEHGVDLGMLVSNLKLSLDERIERLQGLLKIQHELRNAPWTKQ